MSSRILAAPIALALVLGGCASKGDLDISEAGAGVTAVRTACPTVGVPAATGDVTLFDPATSRDATAIDVVGAMTDVRSTCGDSGDDVVTNVTFTVLARRSNASGPRDVTLPYFITVVQGGSAVVAKRVGQVVVHFNDGQARASANGSATAVVSRAAATLSDEVKRRITERRKAGSQSAAVDPLSAPDVRAAVLRASFEALVGFQLSDDQLKYNATR
ncbi:MAG: hypothetical protein J0I47_10030 [Sphingomonas sp.]|uniref:hypothetical protein n=1 Tax=Sphingomonas sp. TaxID=28214 RepID=UPI001AD0B271|nr:hypothetical protein [Sphingomonas sp.]MBN8808552.1 hypothetical protein [Sphingomonas sp.]